MRLIIHHNADSDGLLSGAICVQAAIRDDVEFRVMGWDYGDGNPNVAGYDHIVMADISIDSLLEDPEVRSRVTLIDHHKTALEKWEKYAGEFKNFLVDTDVAACRLCWWVFENFKHEDKRPRRQARAEGEPALVYLVGLRDTAQHRGTASEMDCEHLELGIRAQWPPDFGFVLASSTDRYNCGSQYVSDRIEEGAVISDYAESQNMELSTRGAMIREWEGVRFLCVNSIMRGSGRLLSYSESIASEQPHDAFLFWGVLTGGKVTVSLYQANHLKPDIDLSPIARRHGGGGHAGACGFLTELGQIQRILGVP